MKTYPQSMLNLMREPGMMPGIGQKSAERISALHLRLPHEDAMRFMSR